MQDILDALLDSWDRNNTILKNLVLALPEDALDLRATSTSQTIGGLIAHMHYCRVVFVKEDAPESAIAIPDDHWRSEQDPRRLAVLLDESSAVVKNAVRKRLATGQPMDTHYDHPILLLQHMIWHEGYHHGQIKLTLKQAGQAFDDEEIGAITWDVWMDKADGGQAGGRAGGQ
ncbi:MAG TPA: DinB family protein [Gemmatimonadales bacterium]|nr:DinB family protein [Gemmatimonadales bacterium]